jgi:hypothetical protein
MVALAQQQKAAAMTSIRKKNQQNCRGKRQQIGNSPQRLAWQECESFRGTSALSAHMGQMHCEQRNELAAFHCPMPPLFAAGRTAHLDTAEDAAMRRGLWVVDVVDSDIGCARYHLPRKFSCLAGSPAT